MNVQDVEREKKMKILGLILFVLMAWVCIKVLTRIWEIFWR